MTVKNYSWNFIGNLILIVVGVLIASSVLYGITFFQKNKERIDTAIILRETLVKDADDIAETLNEWDKVQKVFYKVIDSTKNRNKTLYPSILYNYRLPRLSNSVLRDLRALDVGNSIEDTLFRNIELDYLKYVESNQHYKSIAEEQINDYLRHIQYNYDWFIGIDKGCEDECLEYYGGLDYKKRVAYINFTFYEAYKYDLQYLMYKIDIYIKQLNEYIGDSNESFE